MDEMFFGIMLVIVIGFALLLTWIFSDGEGDGSFHVPHVPTIND